MLVLGPSQDDQVDQVRKINSASDGLEPKDEVFPG